MAIDEKIKNIVNADDSLKVIASVSKEGIPHVKAKVAIEEIDDGEVLAVKMNDGEPVQNVPRSFKEDGHQILKLFDNEDGTYTLLVKKVEE